MAEITVVFNDAWKKEQKQSKMLLSPAQSIQITWFNHILIFISWELQGQEGHMSWHIGNGDRYEFWTQETQVPLFSSYDYNLPSWPTIQQFFFF